MGIFQLPMSGKRNMNNLSRVRILYSHPFQFTLLLIIRIDYGILPKSMCNDTFFYATTIPNYKKFWNKCRILRGISVVFNICFYGISVFFEAIFME